MSDADWVRRLAQELRVDVASIKSITRQDTVIYVLAMLRAAEIVAEAIRKERK